VNLYDEKQARFVEKSIREANLDLTPQAEGGVVKVKTL